MLVFACIGGIVKRNGHYLNFVRMGVKYMYVKSTVITLAAWFVGLLIDANLDFGDPQGFLCLRVLFPILSMGLCVIKTINDKK